jgi:hypothetical protein
VLVLYITISTSERIAIGKRINSSKYQKGGGRVPLFGVIFLEELVG